MGSRQVPSDAPFKSSLGHTRDFRSVPSAHTLVRRVSRKCLRPHSAGSTLPLLWPTGSSGLPHRLRPGASPHALRIPPHGGHPALQVGRNLRPSRCRCLRASALADLRSVIPSSLASEALPPPVGYSPLYLRTGGTLTLMSRVLPGTHYGTLRPCASLAGICSCSSAA